MANILDYIEWRGDLTMDVSPFNEVDNLILSEFSYLDLTDIVSNKFNDEPISLSVAVNKFFQDKDPDHLSLGLILPKAIFDMAKLMAKAPRYKDMLLWGYTNHVDKDNELQFSAICIDISRKTTFISYRGTDDSLIGWKEDFNMALFPHVPSQLLAVKYVELAARFTRNKLLLGGHSKGGNLAVYSGVKANKKVGKRIQKIYCNDGPGFSSGFLSTKEYLTVKNKIVSIVPEGSIVGLLLEHLEDHIIVASSTRGVFQHDGYSWLVKGNQFVHSHGLNQESLLINRTVTSWLATMTDEQKKEFGDALFDALLSSDANTLEELNKDKRKLFKALSSVDSTKRKFINEKLGALLKEGRINFFTALKEQIRSDKN